MRSTIAGCMLLAAMVVALAQSDRAAKDESARILSLENAWNQAEVHHDIGALRSLLADSFVYTESDGSFYNSDEWLAHVKSEADQYDLLGNSKMEVHLYGSAAVVTGEYREKIKVGGKMALHTGRFTDTWIQESSQWKCVASQTTLIGR
jgi:ketosteroid isomerase-like protein